jgi:hypothetical protein
LPGVLALSSLSYRFIERPFLEKRVRYLLPISDDSNPGKISPAPA